LIPSPADNEWPDTCTCTTLKVYIYF